MTEHVVTAIVSIVLGAGLASFIIATLFQRIIDDLQEGIENINIRISNLQDQVVPFINQQKINLFKNGPLGSLMDKLNDAGQQSLMMAGDTLIKAGFDSTEAIANCDTLDLLEILKKTNVSNKEQFAKLLKKVAID